MTAYDRPFDEILIFTRYPRAGKVKTRLIEKLGPGEAARVHSLLTEHALSQGRLLARIRPVILTVWYTGGTPPDIRGWLGDDIAIEEQEGRDLGQRMAAAFKKSWAGGTRAAVLIGSDCPSLDAALLADALDRLRHNDLVLGPSADGGYYLIGLHHEVTPEKAALLFKNIDWGTPEAFRQTVAQAAKADLSISILKELHDIDRPEDLAHFHHYTDLQRRVQSR